MKNRLTTIFIAAVAMAALTAPPVLAKADKGNKGKDKQEFKAESKKEFKQDRIHPAQRGQSDKARSRSAVESQTARRDAAPALQKERALRELKFQNRSHLNMLDPFGHDRESDRKALYGNNGRVVRAIEPTPDPVPDPDPLPDPDPEPTPEPGDPEPGSPEPEPGDPGGDSGSDDGESPPPSNPEPEAIMVPSMPF